MDNGTESHAAAVAPGNWAKGALLLAILIVVLGVPVLFIPDDILRTSSTARVFTDSVASVVPMIDRAAAYSAVPDVLRFYFACLWSLYPLFVAGGVLLVWLTRSRAATPTPAPMSTSKLVILAAAALLLLYMVLAQPFPRGRLLRAAFGSRLGLFFSGPLHVLGATFCSWGLIVIYRLRDTGHARETSNHPSTGRAGGEDGG